MNPKFSVLLAALALAAGASAQAADRAEGHHHGAAGEARELQLDAGRKWPTDAPLRRAMGDINAAVAKALPRIHDGRFADADYDALAATVGERVGYAVQNCKLEPRADAMLHLVIADLMAGAETLQGKTAAPRHDGAVRVREALKAYGEHFDHPGWKVAED